MGMLLTVDKLQVWMTYDNGWVAQGREVGHMARGITFAAAQTNFIESLTACLHDYMKRHAQIFHFLQEAPHETQNQYLSDDKKWICTQPYGLYLSVIGGEHQVQINHIMFMSCVGVGRVA